MELSVCLARSGGFCFDLGEKVVFAFEIKLRSSRRVFFISAKTRHQFKFKQYRAVVLRALAERKSLVSQQIDAEICRGKL